MTAGNVALRNLIRFSLDKYANAQSKIEKTVIVSEVVDSVMEKTEAGFVRFDKTRSVWEIVSDKLAREKVGQGFRAALKGTKANNSAALIKQSSAAAAVTDAEIRPSLARFVTGDDSNPVMRAFPSGPQRQASFASLPRHIKSTASETPSWGKPSMLPSTTATPIPTRLESVPSVLFNQSGFSSLAETASLKHLSLPSKTSVKLDSHEKETLVENLQLHEV